MGGEGELPVTETITLTQEESKRMVLLESTYTVSSEELLRQAGFLVEQIEKREAETKGTITAKRVPVLADSLVGMQTKSAEGFGEGDGKVYIVSLGDGLGFGLFAGDKRGGGLIGYSEEGDFDPDAAPAEAQFLFQALTDYVSNTIEQTEAMRGDSIYEALAAKVGPIQIGGSGQTKNGDGLIPIDDDPPPGEPTEWTPPADFDSYFYRENLVCTYQYRNDYNRVGPLLTTKWNQRAPYNNYIMTMYGNVPVGCVATAVAQIMNYHKKGSYAGRNYLWQSFQNQYYGYETDPATTSLAQLFYDLGLPANLNMNYAPSGSGALSSTVPRTFSNFGYTSSLHDNNYNATTEYSKVLLSIERKEPVYMSGSHVGASSGHAWVVDGRETLFQYTIWKRYCYYKDVLVKVSYDYTYNGSALCQFHHNWGWGGMGDCWLYQSIFSPSGYTDNYNTQMEVVTNIR